MKLLSAVVRWSLGLTALFPLAYAAKEKDCALASTGVYVATSSDAEFIDGVGYLRWVQVHWFGIDDFQAGDAIGLWREDPAVSPESVVEKQNVSSSEGMFMTQERWNGSQVPAAGDLLEDSCLPYWAGYLRDGVVLHSSCLMMRPHWMSSMKSEISSRRISEVALPGAHDAGSAGHFATLIGSLVGRWTFTQDEHFWQQLVFGIRYVDVRIAYYNSTTEKFYVNHGDVRIAPLQVYIDDIADFMSQSDEIVIFDVHSLEHGFSGYPEREEELILLLESSFRDWIIPRSFAPNPTLSELWENNVRLVVTYPDPTASPLLWDNVHHLWGDVNELEALKNFMYEEIPKQAGEGYLWSAMTEFTPTPLDVAIDRWGGLRGAAKITNSPVTTWFRNDWWNMVNIVSMDFFLSSDIVSVAVQANEMRLRCAERREAVRVTNSSIPVEEETFPEVDDLSLM